MHLKQCTSGFRHCPMHLLHVCNQLLHSTLHVHLAVVHRHLLAMYAGEGVGQLLAHVSQCPISMLEIRLDMLLQLLKALLRVMCLLHYVLQGCLVLMEDLLCVVKLNTHPPQVLQRWQLGCECSQVQVWQGWEEGGMAGSSLDRLAVNQLSRC